jgi:hypothetical protein
LISKGANKLAPHLGEAGRRRLKDALARTTVEPSLWLMPDTRKGLRTPRTDRVGRSPTLRKGRPR